MGLVKATASLSLRLQSFGIRPVMLAYGPVQLEYIRGILSRCVIYAHRQRACFCFKPGLKKKKNSGMIVSGALLPPHRPNNDVAFSQTRAVTHGGSTGPCNYFRLLSLK